MKDIVIPQTTVTLQEEIKFTGDKVLNPIVTDDLFTFASITFTFGGKTFSGILWDENTTPTYSEVGTWGNEDVVPRILEILNQQ